jgi:two-component system sensor histidine kinase BaeS
MRRRLTLAILGTVIATLVVAGLGTLLLARFGARQQTEDDLRKQANEIAATISDVESTSTVRVLNNLRRALDLQGIQVLRIGPGGRVVDPLPAGVTEADLDVNALRAGRTLTGNHGSLVYAAAPARVTQSVLPVVVVTRSADPLLRPAVGWFLIAAAVTLGLGALVAWLVSRRLLRPIEHAEVATRRIAAGDLTTRVPDEGGDDELTALVRSINTMAETLERSRGVEQQFLLSVSHDLRTPLTSIRGYAEAIVDGALPEPAAGGAVILAEARRLERLVRDLLDLAKLETRQFTLERHEIDLADVAIGTADGFRPEADDAGIRLDVTCDQAAIVDGDADRLAQVGANLVENALRFARANVRLVVSAADGWARLDVIDDGPGIAEQDLPHVFERLYVSRHEPQRKEVGSGLGLAISRELVTALGGRVWASAAPGGGACLSVALPLVSSPSS